METNNLPRLEGILIEIATCTEFEQAKDLTRELWDIDNVAFNSLDDSINGYHNLKGQQKKDFMSDWRRYARQDVRTYIESLSK